LNRSKYKLITASNGKDALKLYEKHREEIRLVVLDLVMPGMDGKYLVTLLLDMTSKRNVIWTEVLIRE